MFRGFHPPKKVLVPSMVGMFKGTSRGLTFQEKSGIGFEMI